MRIEASSISLIYDANFEDPVYALRDIDFKVEKGQMTGIMGPSGSGKSSLLYTLSNLKRPTSGTIYYDDVDIESYTLKQLAAIRRSHFGFVFQRHYLIDYLSILDNVLATVNRGDAKWKQYALELLERLKISHLKDRKPSQISGGQRQRAAIARALINHPKVIFADEPTASLDHKNAREIMNVIEEFKDEAAIVIVTHDAAILENADSIVELWDGCLVI